MACCFAADRLRVVGQVAAAARIYELFSQPGEPRMDPAGGPSGRVQTAGSKSLALIAAWLVGH